MPHYVEPFTPFKENDLRLKWSNVANTITTFTVIFMGLKCTGGWLSNRAICGIAGLAAYNQFMTDPEMRGWAEDCIDHGMLVNPNPYTDPKRNPRAVLLDPTAEGPVRDR